MLVVVPAVPVVVAAAAVVAVLAAAVAVVAAAAVAVVAAAVAVVAAAAVVVVVAAAAVVAAVVVAVLVAAAAAAVAVVVAGSSVVVAVVASVCNQLLQGECASRWKAVMVRHCFLRPVTIGSTSSLRMSQHLHKLDKKNQVSTHLGGLSFWGGLNVKYFQKLWILLVKDS